MEPILCKTHNVPKVAMRNRKGAPMLGCPQCRGVAAPPAPEPAPPTPPKPADDPPAKPKVGWFDAFTKGW